MSRRRRAFGILIFTMMSLIVIGYGAALYEEWMYPLPALAAAILTAPLVPLIAFLILGDTGVLILGYICVLIGIGALLPERTGGRRPTPGIGLPPTTRLPDAGTALPSYQPDSWPTRISEQTLRRAVRAWCVLGLIALGFVFGAYTTFESFRVTPPRQQMPEPYFPKPVYPAQNSQPQSPYPSGGVYPTPEPIQFGFPTPAPVYFTNPTPETIPFIDLRVSS